jgi:hypothetical protein
MRAFVPCVALLVSSMLVAPVLAAPKSDLDRAIALVEANDLEGARRLFEASAENPRIQGSSRARAQLWLGRLSLELLLGSTSEEGARANARARFAAALDLDPAVAPQDDWNPACERLFQEVRSTRRPSRSRPDDVARAAGEADRLREEHKKLQDKLQVLQREQEAERQRAALTQASEESAAVRRKGLERWTSIEESIRELRKDLKAREEHALELSRGLATPVVPRPSLVPSAVGLGLSIASLGAGTYFGVQTRAAKGRFDQTPFQGEATAIAAEGTFGQRTANVLFGVATASAVTAVVLFLLASPESPP